MLKQIIGQPPDATKGDRGADAPASRPAAAPGGPSGTSSMALPRTPSSSPNMTTSKNVLSSDVEIKGSIKFSHDLIIDGRIEGEVSSDGALTVGENALIKGEIKTRAVTLFGKVEGNITVAERCELKSNAVLVGDVTAGTLAIEEGATFLGRSQVGKGATAAAKPAASGGQRAQS
jgi:cytoskeletal protein CcmA (bactofilin family)